MLCTFAALWEVRQELNSQRNQVQAAAEAPESWKHLEDFGSTNLAPTQEDQTPESPQVTSSMIHSHCILALPQVLGQQRVILASAAAALLIV